MDDAERSNLRALARSLPPKRDNTSTCSASRCVPVALPRAREHCAPVASVSRRGAKCFSCTNRRRVEALPARFTLELPDRTSNEDFIAASRSPRSSPPSPRLRTPRQPTPVSQPVTRHRVGDLSAAERPMFAWLRVEVDIRIPSPRRSYANTRMVRRLRAQPSGRRCEHNCVCLPGVGAQPAIKWRVCDAAPKAAILARSPRSSRDPERGGSCFRRNFSVSNAARRARRTR